MSVARTADGFFANRTQYARRGHTSHRIAGGLKGFPAAITAVFPDIFILLHDDARSRAGFDCRRRGQLNLSLAPETALRYRDETRPAGRTRVAPFRAIGGPKCCSPLVTRYVRELVAGQNTDSLPEADMAEKAPKKAPRAGEFISRRRRN